MSDSAQEQVPGDGTYAVYLRVFIDTDSGQQDVANVAERLLDVAGKVLNDKRQTCIHDCEVMEVTYALPSGDIVNVDLPAPEVNRA